MKVYKIKNTHNSSIPIAIATSSNSSKGVILAPGQYCLAYPQMTNIIDAQRKRRFVTLEENFENSKELPYAIAYDEDEVEKYMNT